jgi:membrane protease YdiL (CAAX protease family)
MQTQSSSDSFAAHRPSSLINTFILIGIMVLYPLAGALLSAFVNNVTGEIVSIVHPDKETLPLLRLIQVVGQILVLALPVILLAGLHTASKNPFSRQSLAFLGVGKRTDFGVVLYAVVGIFLLQPMLYSVTGLQDVYLWPALGTAGSEVVHQRQLMESFIKDLALVRSTPELFSVVFVFSLTPAVCEELFFRGYIQQNYTRSMSPAHAVFLTGFVFAFFHLSAANLLPLALLGWYIGYIYSKSGSLLVPGIVHFVNNLAALLMLFFTENGNPVKGNETGTVVHALWWWVIVAVTLLLFSMVIRRFSAASSLMRDA